MEMRDILSVGMAVCDIALQGVSRNIMEIDLCKVERFAPKPGGDALNVAVAGSKLGRRTTLVSVIGRDQNGEFLLSQLEQAGVESRWMVPTDEQGTMTTVVLIEDRGDRHFLSYCPMEVSLRETDVPDDLIRDHRVVHMGSALFYPPMDNGITLDIFRRAHGLGKLTSMDACINVGIVEKDGTLQRKKMEDLFRETDIFIPSLLEASYLTGTEDVREISRAFRPYGMKAFGIKLGSEGCYLTDYRKEYWIPCHRDVPVVDTTGAGDSFMAGFLTGTLEGMNVKEAGIFATAVAAQNIGKVGATAGVESYSSAAAFVRTHPLEVRESLF